MSDTINDDAVQEETIDFVTEVEEPTEVEESVEETVDEPTEVVEESQEETPIEIPHKEDPSRFEFWQSKFSKEQEARKELETKLQSFEQKMESFSKEPEPEPLKPPVKPQSDDPLDKIAYLEQLAEYNNAVLAQTQETFQKQQEAQLKATEQAQFKAYMMGEYQKSGADEKLSAEAFNFFSSEESLNPQTQLEMYQAWKGVSKPNPKVNQMKVKQQKYDTPLPPGVAPGGSEEHVELDYGEDLLNFTKNYRV